MPRDAQQPAYAGPRQPWTRPSFIAAAALMVLVCLIGGAVALSSFGDGGSSPAADPTLPNQQSNVESPGSGSGSGATDPDPHSPDLTDPGASGDDGTAADPNAVPTLPPAGVAWQLFGQTAVPTSSSAGPSRTSATTASGFAHTPTGALLGAAHLLVRSDFSTGRSVWEPTVTQQFVPGADRDRLLAGMRAEPPQPAQPGELAQFAGFLYQSYSSDTAVIGMVLRAPGETSTFYIVTTTLQWRDGDWKMVAPPGGTWRSLSRAASDLSGVVEWGAT